MQRSCGRCSILLGTWVALAAGQTGCTGHDEDLGPGELARVGDVVFGPQDLAAVGTQLGAYAQLRFAGDEGQKTLLEALVVTELLAQEAIEHGLGDDPRVRFAILEEIGSVYRSAHLERVVPHAAVAEDQAALRAYYDAHPEAFTIPERRSMQGVVVPDLDQAEAKLAQLQAGEVQLEDLGDLFVTRRLPRDDHENPTFHPLLFAEGLQAGDWIPHPVVLAETVLVGRVFKVDPPALEPFDDPDVQDRLVEAVRRPRLEAAEQALLAALRERYPIEPR